MQTLVCCRYKGEKKMDEVTHTILPNTAGGGWGGTALGAGFGGLIGSWLANVYASEITDARVSKLKAICKYEEKTQPVQTVPPSVPEQPTPLIDIGLINDTGTGNKTEPTDSDNKRERRTNNRSGND